MPNVSAHFGDRLNESPELIAQEWAVKSTPTPTTSCLNESPELIAQECLGRASVRRVCQGLNESPELIAQELADSVDYVVAVEASMKVLSLLLRNAPLFVLVVSAVTPQ